MKFSHFERGNLNDLFTILPCIPPLVGKWHAQYTFTTHFDWKKQNCILLVIKCEDYDGKTQLQLYTWLHVTIPEFTRTLYNSRGSPVGNKVLFCTDAVALSIQTWTCWEWATCICVFSRSHSLSMANLSVRYLLKSYILMRVYFISLILLMFI